MLKKSSDIPYKSKLVTMIWRSNDEWHFCTNISEKRDLLIIHPKEIMCAWTGQYSTDIFEINWSDFEKAMI